MADKLGGRSVRFPIYERADYPELIFGAKHIVSNKYMVSITHPNTQEVLLRQEFYATSYTEPQVNIINTVVTEEVSGGVVAKTEENLIVRNCDEYIEAIEFSRTLTPQLPSYKIKKWKRKAAGELNKLYKQKNKFEKKEN